MGKSVCCRENGDILLMRECWVSCEWNLVSFDPNSKLINNLEMHGMKRSFHVYTNKESLVLVKALSEVLGSKENCGGAATYQGKTIVPRDNNEVKGKRKK